MEKIISTILFILILLITTIALLLFFIKKKDSNYEEIIKKIDEQTQKNKDQIDKYIKQKQYLEKEIKNIKKQLKKR